MLSPDPFLNPATVAAALVAVAALAWLLGRCYENTRMDNERLDAERKAREEKKIPAAIIYNETHSFSAPDEDIDRPKETERENIVKFVGKQEGKPLPQSLFDKPATKPKPKIKRKPKASLFGSGHKPHE